MTRQHKTLENMVEVAENNGISTRKGWTVEYSKKHVRNEKGTNKYGKLGYEVFEINEETYTFIHWGTPILEIKRTGHLLRGYETTYKIIYGESKSDSDAINAMLQHFGIEDVKTTFRPVNGGFIIL